MQPLWLLTLLYLCSSACAASLPSSLQLHVREPDLESEYVDLREFSVLEKRKGGGGGRGGSGGKGGGSSSSGSGGRSPSSYSFRYTLFISYLPFPFSHSISLLILPPSTTQNTGGRTISGSGLKPAYNGRYAGGATVPYTSGQRSPTRGFLPLALPITAFAFFPGLWLYGSLYAYPYHSPYWYYNNGHNQTANVTCLCQKYSECGS